MSKHKSLLSNSSELCLIGFAISILFILFVPISPSLLDVLLIMNFSWAFTILLVSFYTDKPLSFSTFPAILLLSTLFRLALNISATRLILSDADAGKVIKAMGQYVIHGNYVMGLVVFFILIIVQFVVVTNGSQRVAEVAARFTLDSLPGKQMSIDADLNTGGISQAEAKIRRGQIEKEANFYGAMDGASKFVKGDAIAGILIILVDIIGGFAVGIAQKGYSFAQSIQTYTLLTVGDGLVTQIPALIISTATGIIVTRAATDAHLGTEIAKQIGAYPKSLMMVTCGLIALIFLKGIPLMPIALVLALLLALTWLAMKQPEEITSESPEENLYQKIRIYPIEIALNQRLFEQLQNQQDHMLEQIQQIREKTAVEFGLILPEVQLSLDNKLAYPYYQLAIHGNKIPATPLYMDKILAISRKKNLSNSQELQGIEVHDPSYGLPAIWLDPIHRDQAIKQGYKDYDPLTVLLTHLNETIQNHCAELLTRNETEKLLQQDYVRALGDELIPSLLTLSQVQKVLQNLLAEKVSIRPLAQIMELLLEHAKKIPDPNHLTELVRAGLASAICSRLATKQNSLPVLTLNSQLEQELNQQIINQELLALDPKLTESLLSALVNRVEQMLADRKRPILLCSSVLRRPIKQITQRVIPQLTVLAMHEIPVNIQVESFAVVN